MKGKGVVHMYDRKSQAAWDRRHLRTVSARVPIEDHEAFHAAAANFGCSGYALTRALVLRAASDPPAAAAFLGDSL